MKIFDAFCKINMRGAFQVEELALMIRATRGRSMDGWMDGWMDGEVLIIGRVVGWSGGVPKGLPCVRAR